MRAGPLWLPLLALTLGAAALCPERARAAGPIVRTTLDAERVVPGQAVVFSVTVLVPTWLPEAPGFPRVEMTDVAVRLPPESTGPTRERVGGETWSGVRRNYHLYPLSPGRYEVPAQTVRVVAADPDTRKPVAAAVRAEAVAFEAVRPAGTEDLDPFIAAAALELEASLEPAPDSADGEPPTLAAGGALTRTVTVNVAGTTPMMIPPLVQALESRTVAAYAEEPVVEERASRDAFGGLRREVVTYVAERGGTVDVPPIRLRWYDTGREAIATAELEGFTIRVDGASPTARTDWRAVAPWLALTALAVLSGVAVLARLWPRLGAWRASRRAAHLASERFAFARVRAAARARRLGATLSAVDAWTNRLPAIGAEEERSLQRTLLRLGAARYSSRGSRPSGNGAWSTLRATLLAVRRGRRAAAARRSTGTLPPLNPVESTQA